MKRLRYWLVALLVVVIPVTGMAAAGITCCKENSKTQAAVAHEHQMHHHDVSAKPGGKLARASCHCAHCAMGCGSACVTAAVAAIEIDVAGSSPAIDVSLSRAVPAHHLDPFRPPIRRV